MKHTHSLLALALLAGGSLFLPACNDRQAAAAPAQTAAVREPTDARLFERARERWGKVAKGDWIAAYDYQTPEQKRSVSLGQYISSKDHHKYESPEVHEVLQNDGKLALLRVSAYWTPVHPLLKEAELEPGQTLTQHVEMYESWRFADGDWLYMRAQRAEDFFQEHPELLRAREKVGEAAPAPK